MIEIRSLTMVAEADLKRVGSGYVSDSKYSVAYTQENSRVSFDLRRVPLDTPYHKRFDHYDDETFRRYERIIKDGYSFGAYDGHLLVGLVIAEPFHWNRSLSVWEFHVDETYRNQGIGKRLMERVAEKAKRHDFRIIVCETQNTNAIAIDVYGKLGFSLEGIDISYYSNRDYPDGEIAVFMKQRL